jgi:uncharacterized protein YecE (DUF72 family)
LQRKSFFAGIIPKAKKIAAPARTTFSRAGKARRPELVISEARGRRPKNKTYNWHNIGINASMPKNCFIGCSGYYYGYWKERFYPKGLASKDWLTYYSSVFNTVELNSTFYRTPQLSSLKKYVKQTPPSFRFSAKMSKYITHTLRLKESEQHIRTFQDLLKEGLGKKLNHFLFQMPPSFKYSEENLDRILQNIPHRSHNVIEFRDISWWNADTEANLKKARITFCNVDYPGLTPRMIHTTPLFYMRFHGNPELFKSEYSLAELKKFQKKFPVDKNQCSIYFNNTMYEGGYTNASQMKHLIEHA